MANIAQVVCAWPPYAGGIGNSAAQIERLLSFNHQVASFHPDNLRPWLRRGHGAFAPSLLWRLRHFDFIYLHYPFFGGAELVWLFKLISPKTRLIIHYHMDAKLEDRLALWLSRPGLWLRPCLLRQAEKIVCGSLDYVKHSQISGYFQKHPEKFVEIPFGLDIDLFQPKAVNRPARNPIMAKAQDIIRFVNEKFIRKDQLRLIFVGGLDRAHYFKGVDILLKALGGLKQRRFKLTICGEGDLKAGYKLQAENLGLAEKVEFLGKLSQGDLIRVLQSGDVLVLPSINGNEAFGLVLIEAMACGLPVVASDLPGVRSVFSNYQEGLLVAPGDEADLRRKIEFMMDNELLRQDMAKKARRLAEAKYDIKRMAESLKRIFS